MALGEIACQIVDESEKAYLVDINGDHVWVPKSVSEWHPSQNKVDGTLEVQQWWAEKEGLV